MPSNASRGLAPLFFNSSTKVALSGATAGPSAKGQTVYFQGVYLNGKIRPLPVTNIWTTRYQ